MRPGSAVGVLDKRECGKLAFSNSVWGWGKGSVLKSTTVSVSQCVGEPLSLGWDLDRELHQGSTRAPRRPFPSACWKYEGIFLCYSCQGPHRAPGGKNHKSVRVTLGAGPPGSW